MTYRFERRRAGSTPLTLEKYNARYVGHERNVMTQKGNGHFLVMVRWPNFSGQIDFPLALRTRFGIHMNASPNAADVDR